MYDERPMLKDIERHVAWFYLAAVRADTKPQSSPSLTRDGRFLRQVLRATEGFTSALQRLDDERPNPDAVLDLAMILSRALEYWNRARARWQSDPALAALIAAAAELTNAADALQDAMTAAPWVENGAPPRNIAFGTLPRRVQ